jgi:hypothetical protein
MKGLAVALFLAVLVLALPSRASAQLASNEVYVNTSFKIAATHDGVNTTEYHLLRGGVLISTLARSALVGTTITFPHAGLAAGTYVFVVEAKGDGGTAASAPFTVVVKVVPVAPSVPSGLRIDRTP